MAEDKITISELAVNFTNEHTGQQVTAVNDFNFSVHKDQFVTIVGPSGCGKSTLLFTVAGLIRPTAGVVHVDGQKVSGAGADRGVVFQDYALLPWKTTRQNIALGPKLRGVTRQERENIADEYLQLFRLTGFGDKYPHELSGGMRQRVAVARTLANSPSVVLMDEPFGALDAQTREDLGEELLDISRRHTMTVLFVTHSVDEAVLLGDRVVVMTPRPGRVREVIDIDIPRNQRDWELLREDATFRGLVARVSKSLRAPAESD